MKVFMSKGNRFEEDLVIDTQKCESAAAALSVGEFESIGQNHYNNWKKSVLDAKKNFSQHPSSKRTYCCSMRRKPRGRQ